MSSWVWVIICILVGGVGCHIILTKSDRTIIYELDESSYKPTPIPLTSVAQVDFRAMKIKQFYLTYILRNRQHFQQPQLLKIWLWQLSHHKTISKFLFFLDSWRGSSPSPASLSPFSFQGMLSMDFIQYPKCQMWIDSMTSERMSPTPDLIKGQLTSLTCQENIMIITRGIRPGLPMNITTLTGQFLSHWSNQALLQDLSEGTHTLGISPMILGRYIIKKDSFFKN